MIKRDLDGAYFRVCRDGKWDNVCFSDLTEQEQSEVLAGRPAEWLKVLCCNLALCLRDVGDKFNIIGDD